jgi:hypothetical protein
VWHQSDPFTLVDGSGREREYVVVEDEFAGAVGTGQSPNGGVWFYEVTGDLERNPSSKPGRWMSGAEAQAYFAERRVALPTTHSLRCVLRESRRPRPPLPRARRGWENPARRRGGAR